MPTWVRHVTSSTSGFWPSTTNTYADNCSEQNKTDINNAFNALNANGGLNCFPMLRDCMRGKWPTIAVDCCFDSTRPPRGGELEALIFVCQMSSQQIQVEICKGLVVGCGGTTLDVKAMQFACFGAPLGVPSPSDFNDMAGLPQFDGNPHEREGTFVIWNRQTGEVWDKITTQVSRAFWPGTDTVPSKGSRCFVDVSWIF